MISNRKFENKDATDDVMPYETWKLPTSVAHIIADYTWDNPLLKPVLFSGINYALEKILFLAENAGPLDEFKALVMKYIKKEIAERKEKSNLIDTIFTRNGVQGSLIQLLIIRFDVSLRCKQGVILEEGMAEIFIKIVAELLPHRLAEVQSQAQMASPLGSPYETPNGDLEGKPTHLAALNQVFSAFAQDDEKLTQLAIKKFKEYVLDLKTSLKNSHGYLTDDRYYIDLIYLIYYAFDVLFMRGHELPTMNLGDHRGWVFEELIPNNIELGDSGEWAGERANRFCRMVIGFIQSELPPRVKQILRGGLETILNHASSTKTERVINLAFDDLLGTSYYFDNLGMQNGLSQPRERRNGTIQQAFSKFITNNFNSIQHISSDPSAATHHTTLTLAASQGNNTLLKHLLTHHRASINAKGAKQRTALGWAAHGGHLHTTKFLLAQQADIFIQDEDRKTPLKNALDAKRIDCAEEIEGSLKKSLGQAVYDNDLEKVLSILKSGRNPNIIFSATAQYSGMSLLFYAIYKKYYDIAKALLHNDADPNIIVSEGIWKGWSPLACLIYQNQPTDLELIQLLLDKNASTNETLLRCFGDFFDWSGWTLLNYLIYEKIDHYLQIAKMLIKHGCSYNAIFPNGFMGGVSIFECLIRQDSRESREILNALLQAGANPIGGIDVNSVKLPLYEYDLRENSRNDITNLWLKASFYFHAANYQEAIREYQEILNIEPHNAYAHHFIAQSYFNLHDFENARIHYESSAKLKPNDNDYLHNLGCTYDRLKRYEDALNVFTQLIERKPTRAIYYNNRAYAYLGLSDFINAASDFQKVQAYQLTPADLASVHKIGSMWGHIGMHYANALHHHSQRNYSSALAELKKAEKSPGITSKLIHEKIIPLKERIHHAISRENKPVKHTRFFSQSSRFETKPTMGGGDCAFHAILGHWNDEQQMYICSDIASKRNELKKAICEAKQNSPFYTFIAVGIQHLVMSNELKTGTAIYRLSQRYNQFEKGKEKEIFHLRNEFSNLLKTYPEVISLVNKNNCSSSKEFIHKFLDALHRNNNELRNYIRTIPSLENAFNAYNMKHNQSFDWSSVIGSNEILEYATFTSRMGQYLLPSDLSIIAHVFNKTVIFYSSDGANPEQYNPEQSEKIRVQLKILPRQKMGHFERMEPILGRHMLKRYFAEYPTPDGSAKLTQASKKATI